MADIGMNDLPVEMKLKIFENLSIHDLVAHCSKTCLQWEEIVAKFFVRPKLVELANVNEIFKRKISFCNIW